MLIRSYGLIWRRDFVDWGRPRVRGTLMGRPVTQRRSKPVDFREQVGIYILYDERFQIVYVGQAGAGDRGLFRRLRSHRRDNLADRWSRFSWYGLLPVENGLLKMNYRIQTPDVGTVLNQMEGIIIATAEPPLNRQGPRFGADVVQFRQEKPSVDNDSEEEDEE